ncbi:MAG: chorismate mutase [Actinomycetia bacterium]|nr:chorismate mutase [Actinomycetes bacterium]
MEPDPLEALGVMRQRLDELDADWVGILAERFAVTDRVGEHKREHGLPAQDPARETRMIERIRGLAVSVGLDPDFAEQTLRSILDESVRNHRSILNPPET